MPEKRRKVDNFGIFKLLNSMYDFYKKGNADKDFGENKNRNAENSPADFKKPSENPVVNPKATASPLQKNMLFTMSNHDEVVRRVLSKNASKK